MKLQCVGDRRDFYKYDLLLGLAEALRPSGGVTVIPMLTRGGERPKEGGLRSYLAKHRDHELWSLVRSLGGGDPSGFGSIVRFFAQRKIPFRFVPDGYFETDRRDRYFAQVAGPDLADCIVFLDPDIGLEVKSSSRRDTRYLAYEELRAVFRRMSGGSVLVLYQHMPRRPHSDVYTELVKRLFERSDIAHTHFLDMGDIGFLAAAQDLDPERQAELARAVGRYAQSRGVRQMSAGVSRTVLRRNEEAPME